MNEKNLVSGTYGNSHIRDFFEQWNLYKKIIDNNYMFHNEITDILNKLFTSYFDRPFSLLDLGCGDSHIATRAIKDTTIISYTGVDLSRTALSFSKKNLADLKIDKEFIQDDLFNILHGVRDKYDVIQIGYSMHHLGYENKRIMIKKCYESLNTSGVLLVYDVCRNNDETRDEYFFRYWANCEEHWDNLENRDLKLLHDHILKYDYPESIDTHFTHIQESGFQNPEILFTDKPKFHFLICSYR